MEAAKGMKWGIRAAAHAMQERHNDTNPSPYQRYLSNLQQATMKPEQSNSFGETYRQDPHCIAVINFVDEVFRMVLSLRSSEAQLQSQITEAQHAMRGICDKIDNLSDAQLKAQAPQIVGLLRFMITQFADDIGGDENREKVLKTLLALPTEYASSH